MPRKKAVKQPTPEPEELPEESDAGSGDGDDSDEEEEVYVEPLLATRTRRANAGNRMQSLIEDEAAAEVEEMFKEEENDEEFAQKEEKDEFDSDFGSTDEEGGEEDDEEAGERRLQREAKEAKKAAASKKKKGFQAPVHPFARQTKAQRNKAARDAEQGGAVASTSASTLDDEGGAPARKRKKVAVDPSLLVPQRESTRRNAIRNREAVQERVKESEKKKASAPVKAQKKAQVTLTQADLIAEALETEEVNRAALLAFYAAEEDRREAERIAGMRYEIIGPKLTFLSRALGGTKGKEKQKEESGRRRMIEVLGESGKAGWKASGAAAGEAPPAGSEAAAAASVDPMSMYHKPASNSPAPLEPSAGPSTPPERTDFTRNWLIFGNTEEEPITRAQELEAVFGEHEDWTKPAPVPTKPNGRGYLCPITGLPAKYRCPRTLTPYATLAAYKILTSLTDQQAYVYSDSLGAYTGTSGIGLIRDVEANWARRPGAKTATSAPRLAAAPPPGSAPPPMVGTPTRVLVSTPAGPAAVAVAGGSGTKKPRAPRQSMSQQQMDNPYKVEYAGTGRGLRGRGSLSGEVASPSPAAGAGYFPPQQPQQGAYGFPQQGGPYGAPGVYSPSALAGGAGSPFEQHPSLVGSSSAPQARSISFGGGGAASGMFGSGPSTPGLPPFPQQQQQQPIFDASSLPHLNFASLPAFPSTSGSRPQSPFSLPPLPGGPGLPSLPPLPGMDGAQDGT
ncbi:hypothetical protein JCM10213_008721 [Rhodosporidiobolus nylandii]